MHTYSLSITADAGARSERVTLSGVSAQSAVYGTSPSGAHLLVTPDTNCFMRCDANPTAVATGVDMILLANTTYRVQIGMGVKLAFITSGAAGNVYITPELGA